MTRSAGPSFLLPVLAVVFVGLAWLALLDASYLGAGGALEYPLPAVQERLALARDLGATGVGAAGLAGTAASPLYTLLLIPVAGDTVQRLMPLYLNGAGLVLAAALWGRILWQAGGGVALHGVLLAALGPIALNFQGLAFAGTEHALHLAACLAILSGLFTMADRGRVGGLLLAGVLLAPMLRAEGLVLAGLAGLFLLVRRRFGAGGVVLVLGLAPMGAFLYALGRAGHDLPALLAADGMRLPLAPGAIPALLSEPGAQVLAAMLAVGLGLAILAAPRRGGLLGVLAVAVLAGAAHLLFGGFGAIDRYALYATALVATATLAVALDSGARQLVILALLPLVFSAVVYMPQAVRLFPDARAEAAQ